MADDWPNPGKSPNPPACHLFVAAVHERAGAAAVAAGLRRRAGRALPAHLPLRRVQDAERVRGFTCIRVAVGGQRSWLCVEDCVSRRSFERHPMLHPMVACTGCAPPAALTHRRRTPRGRRAAGTSREEDEPRRRVATLVAR